ncbi:hypothetical protein N7462_011403 [Penicillium macrosclerotiorum]|uniref:uncharacterized protein n=1 Tax=Penicillium macrosclerotiorum TaxID=303699 RepID=UPI0025484C12|nr:uncharacterized protein N7462_011403 [Penicillium macrosclerotiorum]KAJ5664590.1 hypothetical protein N7462_011403 [Penicillium macrosclerotiorum]
MLEYTAKLPTSSTRYNISGGNWNSEYQVTSDGAVIYHVKNSSPSQDKPDLTFYSGASTDGSVAGSGKFVRFSSNIQLSLADPSQPSTTTSVCLNKKGIISTRYTLQMTIEGQARSLAWKNTEMNDSFGPSASHKLVDEANEVLAVFSPGGGRVQKDGVLEVFVDYGTQFDLMALIGALALREKSRKTNFGPIDVASSPASTTGY